MNERTYSAKEIQSGGYSHDGSSGGGSGRSGRNGGNQGQNQDRDQDQDEDQDEDRGAPAPSSAPSSNYANLEHNGYTIRYPQDWRAYGDPKSPVTIAPPNGIVNNAVAYGAMVNTFQPANGAGIGDATQQLVQSLQKSNAALKNLGKSEPITVNGVHGLSVDMVGQSPLADPGSGEPQRERDWLVTLPRGDGSLEYVIFIAPDAEFMGMRPTFQQMLRSLHLK
jgi:hypothetical protein